LQAALDALRVKLIEPVTSMMAATAKFDPSASANSELAKQVLSTPISQAGNRVTMKVIVPAAQSSTAMQSFTATGPSSPVGGWKLGKRPVTPATSPGAPTTPVAPAEPATSAP
jgi:hypothetical protein